MPEVAKYAPGTPSWVDLSSPDLEASARFYRELFGWTAQASEDPEARGYTMLQQGGKNVAGMGPAQPGQPPAWTSYVTVEDADAAAKRVEAAGGSVLLPPMDVMDVGRMAIFADPAGAVIAVWQPRSHKGADLVNEPNSLCWNELQTRDLAKATPLDHASSNSASWSPASRAACNRSNTASSTWVMCRGRTSSARSRSW